MHSGINILIYKVYIISTVSEIHIEIIKTTELSMKLYLYFATENKYSVRMQALTL